MLLDGHQGESHAPVLRAISHALPPLQLYFGMKSAVPDGGNIGFCWKTKHGTSGEASFVWQAVSDL